MKIPNKIFNAIEKRCTDPRKARKVLTYYHTNAGWLTLSEIAERRGQSIHTLYTRIAAYGMRSKWVFADKIPRGKYGVRRGRKLLEVISDKPRNKNLDKLKLGTWEESQCHRNI